MSLVDTWEKQYEGEEVTALKDANLFRLEVDAILAAVSEHVLPRKNGSVHLLELGCGTGELIRQLDRALSAQCDGLRFKGVDFSENAVKLALDKGGDRQTFEASEFSAYMKAQPSDSVDIVVTQRAIMALMDEAPQRELLAEVNRVLRPDGVGVFSECFAGELERFDALRRTASLSPIGKVWHSRHLEESMFEGVFAAVEYRHFCSTYMLITRVIYPTFIEEPAHNQRIHDIAAKMPNSGTTSFLKLVVTKKRP
jgi:SAM-dependent methyltransferase